MAQPWNTLATHSGIDGAAHKSKGDGCHALGGCQNSKSRRHLYAHFGRGRGHLLWKRCTRRHTHTHILYRYCTLSDSLFYPLFSLPCLMQSSAAEELSMSWSQRYGAIARPHGSWVRSGQRTVAFHQSQHGDLTNQSRKKGDIVSNKWCYPLAMTNIAIEHDHL